MQDDLVFRGSSEVFGGSRMERERFPEVFRQGKGGAAFPEFPKTPIFRKTSVTTTIKNKSQAPTSRNGAKIGTFGAV